MPKLYLFAAMLVALAINSSAQETTGPVNKKINRIILHFKDTTGLFVQLGRILIDRDYDIDFKDAAFGVIKTKSKRIGSVFNYDFSLKAVFRDSTITFTGLFYNQPGSGPYDIQYKNAEITKSGTGKEILAISALLHPASVTYKYIELHTGEKMPPPAQRWGRF